MLKNILSIIVVLILVFSYKYYKKLPSAIKNNNDTKEEAVKPKLNYELHKLRRIKDGEDIHAIMDDDVVYGNRNASVVMVEYFSPTCPHCDTFHKRMFPKIKKKYIDTGKIAYVSRIFIGNKQDFDAAVLAKCSGDMDKYSQFVEVLLSKQSSWAFSKKYKDLLTNIGMLGGVSAEQFAKCLNDKDLIDSLRIKSSKITAEPGFVGTPTFVINGKHHKKSYSVKDISKEIDAILNENKTKSTANSI